MSQIRKRAQKIARKLPASHHMTTWPHDHMTRAFALVSRVETTSATFARLRDRMEAPPLDFSYFRNVSNVELSFDLDFTPKELDVSLRL